MSARLFRALSVLAALCVLASDGAHAQRPVAPAPQGPGTLVGLVVDSTGIALGDVTVFIVQNRRTARTRANGTFRFDSLPSGKYTIGARVIGFMSGTGDVTVNEKGGVAIIEMVRLPVTLSSISTTATRGGLSGVIADTAYKALADVKVQVLGSGAGTTATNSRGEFFLPVKPGEYVLRIDLPGYQYQLIGVTVPAGEGRRVAAFMSPSDRKIAPREGLNLHLLRERLLMRTAASSKLYTRAELNRLNIPDAFTAVQRFLVSRTDPDACALIDGGPDWAPLWSISSEEIELLEVYGKPGSRQARQNMVGRCTHIVWLRR